MLDLIILMPVAALCFAALALLGPIVGGVAAALICYVVFVEVLK